MRRPARCFQDDFEKNNPYVVFDAGIRVIEVRKIVGTLDKCGELDEQFRYMRRKDRVERSRRFHLERAAQNYYYLPPIEVYQYRGNFYVVDGNRRVSAAKAQKMEYLDANIKEYIHRAEGEVITGAMMRRRFESETNLRNINLTSESGYGTILGEIERYPGENMQEKAKKWQYQIFLPACDRIRRSDLPRFYPDLSAGDIFVLVARFYNEFLGEIPAGDFDTVISSFMFFHTLPERRTWRGSLYRFMVRLLSGKWKKLELEGWRGSTDAHPRSR